MSPGGWRPLTLVRRRPEGRIGDEERGWGRCVVSHGHHQGPPGVVEYATGRLGHERPPRRSVLEVVRRGQPWRDVHEGRAGLLGVEDP
jgi:hypothetical protein